MANKIISWRTIIKEGFAYFGLVKSEKQNSWDWVESLYSENRFKDDNIMLNLVKTLRKKGFDKSLYAHTSLHTLVLSKTEYNYYEESSLNFCQNKLGELIISKTKGRKDFDILRLPNAHCYGDIEKIILEYILE